MSNLSAFPYFQEREEATPAAFNNKLSIISSNIAAVDTTVVGGHFQQLSIGSTPPSYLTTAAVTIEVNSNQSDYLYLVDSAAQRSSYIIGSRAGGTADGLNIWDVSAGTLVASFSKQSSRFYSPVVGASFDIGGSDFNIRAFSAVGDGVADDINSFLAAIAALPSTGGVISMPSGNYKVTDTINLSFASTGKNSIVLRGAGVGATKITSTVTNRPAIISNDTFNQANILEGFDLYQSGNVLPAFRAGNYGIRNVGGDCPYLSLRNLRVRFFGDIGIRLEAGNGPFSLQDVEVQSCASYGIHLVPLGASPPVEVQIIGGNIHTCVGGLRLTGAVSTGVYDTDIELGTVALYPSLVIDGAAAGGVFNDLSLSVQAVPSPAAVVSISNGFGMVFNGGQYTTASANVDGILLDSTAARLNTFIGGYYTISGGGYIAQCINGAKQNTFIAPLPLNFAAGKSIIKNSSDTGDTVLFVGSSAISDDRTLVLGGGNIAVGSGTALLPSVNFGGTSEVSLGIFRSSASVAALSYGQFDTTRGTLVFAGATQSGDITASAGRGHYFNMSSGNQGYILGNTTILEARGGSGGFRVLNNGGVIANLSLSDAGILSIKSGLSLLQGAIGLQDGSAAAPTLSFSSDQTLGFYRSGASTIAQSFGTFNLATNSVRFSMRTLAASAVTASAAKTNVAVNEVVFTIGGASGASLIIYSGGTAYGFNSAFSAAVA